MLCIKNDLTVESLIILRIKHIEKEKKNLLLTAEKPELTECQRGIDRSEVYYHKRLIQFADALQPNPIPESWIKRITEVLTTDFLSFEKWTRRGPFHTSTHGFPRFRCSSKTYLHMPFRIYILEILNRFLLWWDFSRDVVPSFWKAHSKDIILPSYSR